MKEEVLGKQHISYANTLNNMGSVLRKMGRYSEAMDHFQRSIEVTKEVLGKRHISYASILNNMGSALKIMGRY